jgi:hypothetical protein
VQRLRLDVGQEAGVVKRKGRPRHSIEAPLLIGVLHHSAVGDAEVSLDSRGGAHCGPAPVSTACTAGVELSDEQDGGCKWAPRSVNPRILPET